MAEVTIFPTIGYEYYYTVLSGWNWSTSRNARNSTFLQSVPNSNVQLSTDGAGAGSLIRSYLQFDLSTLDPLLTPSNVELVVLPRSADRYPVTCSVAYGGTGDLIGNSVEYSRYIDLIQIDPNTGQNAPIADIIFNDQSSFFSCSLNTRLYPFTLNKFDTYDPYIIALVAPPDFNNEVNTYFGRFVFNSYGSDYSPYLRITYGEGGYPNSVIGVPPANISTVMGVPTANISKVMGV